MSKHKEIYLEDIVEQTLRLLKANLDNLETSMAEDEIGEFNVSRANAATGIARGLSSVLKEARALNKMNREAMTNLGPSEKRRLIIEWFEKQPVEVQKSLLFEMTGVINKERKNAG
jgi:hypothetical protein